MDLVDLIEAVAEGRDLGQDEAADAFGEIMAGRVSPVLTAALLVALRTKGHAPSEVAGGVSAMRAAMVQVPAGDPAGMVDTCGTGGGSVTTFNISTAAALVAAGAGVRVAKHGNRSFTSKSGSADVLEALGVEIQLSAEEMGEVLHRAGIVFMFAPLLHPAMKHVVPVRRELRIRTIMNLMGPLTNPAGVRRQVVGVSDPDLIPLIGEALRALDHERALVVHGTAGMDEISPRGATPEVDKPIAGLIRDLKLRGLLDDTLVLWGGEFGRTPTCQGAGKDGRDHNPEGFTMWMVGGGVRSGIQYGKTDDYGYYAAVDKVHVHDLHATLLHLLGIDHLRLTYRHAGRDFRLTDVAGRVVEDIIA